VNNPDEIHQDLPPDLDQSERQALAALGTQLQTGRPIPGPMFRGNLRRRLVKTQRPSSAGPMKLETVRLLIATYLLLGTLLIAIGALGVAGSGPFAAS
jgi:hypothetical protein